MLIAAEWDALRLRALSKAEIGRDADVYLNMPGVTGTGQTTGGMYIGTGSNKFVNVAFPGDPIIPPDPIHANFYLEAARRGGSVQLPLTFDLRFGTDGTLLASSTVSVTSD
jgi:hypothetical protein